MNKNITVNEVSGGWGAQWTYSYTDMAAILDFSFYSGYLLYNTSNLFWISSDMYLCFISTHELLLFAAIICWRFF